MGTKGEWSLALGWYSADEIPFTDCSPTLRTPPFVSSIVHLLPRLQFGFEVAGAPVAFLSPGPLGRRLLCLPAPRGGPGHTPEGGDAAIYTPAINVLDCLAPLCVSQTVLYYAAKLLTG